MNDIREKFTKNKLLRELSNYVDIKTGRKVRADKGSKRKAYVYNKSDLRGRKGSTNKQSKSAIFHRVLARLKNKDKQRIANGETERMIGYDDNGFFLVIAEAYLTKGDKYQQTYQGRVLQHNVKRVRVQKEIDMELYRFEAFQELATTLETKYSIVRPSPELNQLLISRYSITPEQIRLSLSKRQLTYYELFQELYFVDEPELWSYETWREHYDRCPKEPFDESFRFNLNYKPGTPEFHPEFAYYVNKRDQLTLLEKEQERERRAQQFVSNIKRKGSK